MQDLMLHLENAEVGLWNTSNIIYEISHASVCMFGVVNRSNAKLVILCTNF